MGRINDKLASSDIENPVAYSNAVKGYIIANAMKTFERTHDRAAEVIAYVKAYAGPSEFIQSLSIAFDTYGKISQKQYNAVCNHIDTAAERKAAWVAKQEAINAASSHIGQSGDRIEGEFEVMKMVSVEAKKFHYHDRASIDIITMLHNGNIFVIKTKNTPYINQENGDWRFLQQGDKVKLRGTIKEHIEYKGTKQTILQRAKILEFLN